MRTKGPRLYFNETRKSWVIRDGVKYLRTGCSLEQRSKAEEKLSDYIASKYKPAPSPSPLLADVFRTYLHHRPKQAHCISNLKGFWAEKIVSDVNSNLCREYAAKRPPGAGRRDLQTLKASINYWHREIHALPRIPTIELPPPGEPRDRWLSRNEMARILWEARHIPHLYRFAVIGYYSGSRSKAILNAEWSWVDFNRGIMHRRGSGEGEVWNKRRPKFKMKARLISHLKRWHRLDAGKSRYIVSYAGKRVNRVTQSWNEACKRAGVKNAPPHVLRHTRVSELLANGVSIWDTAKSVGMSALMVERVYGHIMPGWQEEAASV